MSFLLFFLYFCSIMDYKTSAIVLRSLKYGDKRLIVDMFTRQYGRLSYIVPLSTSARSKIKKQYFQPLTLLYIEGNYRQQSDLQHLSDASLLSPPTSLLTVPTKLALSLFVAEFLCHALRDEQQNEPLFDYIQGSVEWLDAAEQSYANFHLVFLMRLSRFLGFYPNLNLQTSNVKLQTSNFKPQTSNFKLQTSNFKLQTYFDLRSATFCTEPPLHRDFLMPQEAQHIQTLMRMDFPTMHLFHLSRTERNRILEILLVYYRIHLPSFPDLRSLSVLHELWGS